MSLLHAETFKAIPHQLKMPTSRADLQAVSRTTRIFAADRTKYSYNGNPQISIQFPASGIYDLSHSVLQFRLKWDNNAELLVELTALAQLLARDE